jgi:hypothetical protein
MDAATCGKEEARFETMQRGQPMYADRSPKSILLTRKTEYLAIGQLIELEWTKITQIEVKNVIKLNKELVEID